MINIWFFLLSHIRSKSIIFGDDNLMITLLIFIFFSHYLHQLFFFLLFKFCQIILELLVQLHALFLFVYQLAHLSFAGCDFISEVSVFLSFFFYFLFFVFVLLVLCESETNTHVFYLFTSLQHLYVVQELFNCQRTASFLSIESDSLFGYRGFFLTFCGAGHSFVNIGVPSR